MLDFKVFLENIEKETKDILKRIPAKHRALLKDYKFKFENGCSLKKYPDAVGLADGDEQTISIASPVRYSREHVLTHEIGHIVWNRFIKNNEKLREKWNKLLKNTPGKIKQSNEEIFCNSYAVTYCIHPAKTHYHEKLVEFIKSL